MTMRRCERCGGAGWIIHPAWVDFFDEEPSEELPWWWDRGYDQPPPEEVVCPDCDGAGYIERRQP